MLIPKVSFQKFYVDLFPVFCIHDRYRQETLRWQHSETFCNQVRDVECAQIIIVLMIKANMIKLRRQRKSTLQGK